MSEEHVVISLKSLQQSEKGKHEAELVDGTFRAICGADKRMDIPVLVREDDISGFYSCGNCMRVRSKRRREEEEQ